MAKFQTLWRDKDGIGDGAFLALVRRASANATYAYTFNQLFAAQAYGRGKLRPGAVVALLVGLLFFGSGLLKALTEGSKADHIEGALMLATGLVVTLVSVFLLRKRRTILDQEKLKDIVRKWSAAKGKDPQLITKRSLMQPPPDFGEGDIHDYGVERMLVVQREELVDWFVRNHFHADHRTVVVAASGYPAYLRDTAARLLEEIPDLPVFVLHDATQEGEAFGRAVTEGATSVPHWLRDRNVVDLGLFPGDFKKIKRLRPLKPHLLDYRLPVDYLPFAMLSSGLALAMDEGVSLGALLARSGRRGGDAWPLGDGGDGGGFG